jgi:hypothetical protein
MMKIRVTNVTDLTSRQARCFDLHEDFGLATLVEKNGRTTLYLNNQECRSWRQADHPNFWDVRWLEPNKVIAWVDDGFEAVIISTESWRKLAIGPPDDLFVSKSYIFVGYHIPTQESTDAESPHFMGEPIVAFTQDGDYVTGISKFVLKATQPSIEELSAAYILNECLIFIAHRDQLIFRFDPARMELSYFPAACPVTFSIVNAKVFAGDDKQAYAIFDNRVLLSDHPERPAFEFAIFDLVAKTGSKVDFASIEEALVASGFNMKEIKFQPNSIGRIIVSDTTKAGLLEVSDFL